MKINVSLLTILKQYNTGTIGGDGTCNVSLGSSLDELEIHIGIPDNIVKIYLVNGRPRLSDYKLVCCDEVKIFSFLGGG